MDQINRRQFLQAGGGIIALVLSESSRSALPQKVGNSPNIVDFLYAKQLQAGDEAKQTFDIEEADPRAVWTANGGELEGRIDKEGQRSDYGVLLSNQSVRYGNKLVVEAKLPILHPTQGSAALSYWQGVAFEGNDGWLYTAEIKPHLTRDGREVEKRADQYRISRIKLHADRTEAEVIGDSPSNIGRDGKPAQDGKNFHRHRWQGTTLRLEADRDSIELYINGTQFPVYMPGKAETPDFAAMYSGLPEHGKVGLVIADHGAITRPLYFRAEGQKIGK